MYSSGWKKKLKKQIPGKAFGTRALKWAVDGPFGNVVAWTLRGMLFGRVEDGAALRSNLFQLL